MAAIVQPKNSADESDQQKEAWLKELDQLMGRLEGWAAELGWSHRRIEKRLNDSQLGSYSVPAMMLQESFARVLVEPVARFVINADGLVDLYLMPAYDDIASLYLTNGEWNLHYMFDQSPTVGNIREAESKPLTKEAFQAVLSEMQSHALNV